MSRKKKIVLIGVIALIIAVIPLVVLAQDAEDDPGVAYVMVSNFSPNAPPVDVYIDGVMVAQSLPFSSMTFPVAFESGVIFVEVRLTGSAATAPALVSGNAEIGKNEWYVIPAMNITDRAQFGVYRLPLFEPLGPNESRVQFFHAVPQAPRLEVIDVDTDDVLVPALEFGYVEDPYVPANLEAGFYHWQIWTRTGLLTNTESIDAGPDELMFDFPVLDLAPETIYSFFMIGGPVVDVEMIALVLAMPPGGGFPLDPPGEGWNPIPTPGGSLPTPTRTPTFTPTPTGTTTPTVTPTVTLTATPQLISACDCTGSDNLNCSDFSDQPEAQVCYEYCIDEVGTDFYDIDVDNNNLACDE